MRNWGLGDQLLDLLDGLFEPLMAFANEISQSAFAHRAAEKVAKHLTGALVRQQLIVLEVNGCGLDAGAVLHGGVDPFGECRLVYMSASAKLRLGLMLGDDQPQGRQIVDLSFLDAIGRLIYQQAAATLLSDQPCVTRYDRARP